MGRSGRCSHERRRYPAYDHCAVLVAENVTTRFLNVLGLVAGSILLLAAGILGAELFISRLSILGTLAGVAITYIAMGAAFNAWKLIVSKAMVTERMPAIIKMPAPISMLYS